MPIRWGTYSLILGLLLMALIFFNTISATIAEPDQQAEGPIVVNAGDYPNLQSAIDALPKSGGMVVLPAGRFLLDQPLVINKEHVRLTGAGAATEIFNQNTEGQSTILIRAEDYAEKKTKLWQIQLDNFKLIGNKQSGSGILAEGIQEIFLQGLSVSYHGQHGIELNNCYEDPRVSDCLLTYNRAAGLKIDAGHDIVVNANHFEENQDGVVCIDSFNLTMNGNNLDDHLRHGVVIENTYGSVVTGNMIEECQGYAVVLDHDCYGITVSANVIAHDFSGGIDARDAWGCAISANTFTLVHEHAVRVSENSGRLTITGNSFCNSEIGNGLKRLQVSEVKERRDIGTGILLESTADILISGNSFTGMDHSAVVVKGKSERIAIHGNLVSDYSRQAADSAPFDVAAEAEVQLDDNLTGPTTQSNPTP